MSGSFSVDDIGDNSWSPGIVAQTFEPDQLLITGKRAVTQPVVLASGTLSRGTVVMQQTDYSVTGTVTSTDTGNGTIGSLSANDGAKLGTYTLTATNASTWEVVDPEGNSLPAATTGQAYTGHPIGFTITAGGTAFAAGDTITITVVDSIGNYVLATYTGVVTDGYTPAILADNADASGGPVSTGAYMTGEFNINAVTCDTSFTAESLVRALQPYGIFLKSFVSAADPGMQTTFFA
jgi:hypothetical protein